MPFGDVPVFPEAPNFPLALEKTEFVRGRLNDLILSNFAVATYPLPVYIDYLALPPALLSRLVPPTGCMSLTAKDSPGKGAIP